MFEYWGPLGCIMHAMNSWDKKQWKKKYKLFSGYGFNKCARRKNRGSDKMDRDTAASLLHNSHEQFWAHAFIVTRGESLSDYLREDIPQNSLFTGHPCTSLFDNNMVAGKRASQWGWPSAVTLCKNISLSRKNLRWLEIWQRCPLPHVPAMVTRQRSSPETLHRGRTRKITDIMMCHQHPAW